MIFDSKVIGHEVFNFLDADRLIVHSKFNKGFNIVNERQNMIFIGTDENGLFPFGINVDQQTKSWLLDDVEIGSEIITKNNCLYFDHHILKLNGNILNFKDKLVPQLAFVDEIKKLDFRAYENTDFNKQKVDLLLAELTNGNDDEEMLRYFIGRGSGLTPTGDDILIGMLFVHRIVPFIDLSKIAQIKKILQEDCTTLVSKQFLNLALDGVFSTRLMDLLDETTLSLNIARLLKVGSSSGKDTAYGIFSAL
ncbi:hypothetical protein TP70_00085 [Staphylococcus microti]|uniref:Protein of uncharacterized function (DUF2877) n=1 Tax=Staphylococcus microti TaxID=569857 RepID=A0A0D6XTW6_9STAP|nr:hypothetical protein TP70_00085 [Staphylococcus microti]PNZ84035.1 DUF2877 domain-containing protein [Staphylococcus microti]SUM56495.1 Protein of uncharacterised function (DUF2877) [Staphylococcus microti]